MQARQRYLRNSCSLGWSLRCAELVGISKFAFDLLLGREGFVSDEELGRMIWGLQLLGVEGRQELISAIG